MVEASLPEEPTRFAPVSYRVAHEIRSEETDPELVDLVERLHGAVRFSGQRVLYAWLGGTRSDWRGQGHFRALDEFQEEWAIEKGFREIVVKTKNRYYEMRSTLTRTCTSTSSSTSRIQSTTAIPRSISRSDSAAASAARAVLRSRATSRSEGTPVSGSRWWNPRGVRPAIHPG